MAAGIAYLLSIRIPGVAGEFSSNRRYNARDAWDDYRFLRDGHKFDVTIKQRKEKFARIISEQELEKLAGV